MDCRKIGDLIYKLRKEKNLTQKQIADEMNISDKTISKWERLPGYIPTSRAWKNFRSKCRVYIIWRDKLK